MKAEITLKDGTKFECDKSKVAYYVHFGAIVTSIESEITTTENEKIIINRPKGNKKRKK